MTRPEPAAALGSGSEAANLDLEEDSKDGATAATPQLLRTVDAIFKKMGEMYLRGSEREEFGSEGRRGKISSTMYKGERYGRIQM